MSTSRPKVLGLAAVAVLLLAGCASEPQATSSTTQAPPSSNLPPGVLVSNARGNATSAPQGGLPGSTASQTATGGTTGTPDAGNATPGTDVYALAATWLSVDGRDAREPSLEVNAKGTVFYAARDYDSGTVGTETPVMRSHDQGATWDEVGPRLPTGDRNPPTSGDPMIYLDPDTQRLFQVEQIDTYCHWLVYSDDEGASWTSNPRACTTAPADHQTVAAGHPNVFPATPLYPNLVYVCINQIAVSSCSRSLDGGLSFSGYTVVYPGVATECGLSVEGGLHGHLLAGPDGTLYLPRQYCGLPYVAVSHDDGLTWTRSAVSDLGALGSDPSMAYDATGRVYYAWLAEDHRIHLTWSADAGATWAPAVTVSPDALGGTNLPSLVAGADGRIAVLYMGLAGPLSKDDSDPALEWNGYVTLSLGDATKPDALFATVRANPQGDVLKRGYCAEGRCGLVRDFLDIAMAPDGTVYGAFVDACADACDHEAKDLGEGNANLGYVARIEGVRLK